MQAHEHWLLFNKMTNVQFSHRWISESRIGGALA